MFICSLKITLVNCHIFHSFLKNLGKDPKHWDCSRTFLLIGCHLYLVVVNLIYRGGIGIVESLGGPVVAPATTVTQTALTLNLLP